MVTGLFFGSFNPIHVGHLIIANYMVEYTPIEEVWFVVSPHNPLKNKSLLVNEKHRFEMVKCAIGDDKRFRVSDIEFSMPTPSFTIDTLAVFFELYPEREFAIIMGADGLSMFEKWKNQEEIVKSCKRYIYPRVEAGKLNEEKVENGTIVAAPLLNISSTFIRKAIKDGKDLRYFVPENVWLYIHRHGLYL